MTAMNDTRPLYIPVILGTVRDGVGDISAATMRNLHRRPAVLIGAGKHNLAGAYHRINVKHFAGDKSFQQIISRSFTQILARVKLINRAPDFSRAFSRLDADC